DSVEHRIAFARQLGVPDAEDAEAFGLQPCVASGVRLLTMLAAVELDDQAGRIADEIGDVGADGDLTAEFVIDEAAVLKDEPHLPLGFSGVAAHGFGEAAITLWDFGSPTGACGLQRRCAPLIRPFTS